MTTAAGAVRSELLFDVSIDLEPPLPVGGPAGRRIVIIVRGGTFEGQRLRGEVLAGGGDWALVRPNGAIELDVRLTLRTHDGALIYMHYGGVLVLPAQASAALGRGEEVGPEGIYFRTNPRFETSAPAYGWLNTMVAIGVGSPRPGGVRYRVHGLG